MTPISWFLAMNAGRSPQSTDITLADFYAWNTEVGDFCEYLELSVMPALELVRCTKMSLVDDICNNGHNKSTQ